MLQSYCTTVNESAQRDLDPSFFLSFLLPVALQHRQTWRPLIILPPSYSLLRSAFHLDDGIYSPPRVGAPICCHFQSYSRRFFSFSSNDFRTFTSPRYFVLSSDCKKKYIYIFLCILLLSFIVRANFGSKTNWMCNISYQVYVITFISDVSCLTCMNLPLFTKSILTTFEYTFKLGWAIQESLVIIRANLHYRTVDGIMNYIIINAEVSGRVWKSGTAEGAFPKSTSWKKFKRGWREEQGRSFGKG